MNPVAGGIKAILAVGAGLWFAGFVVFAWTLPADVTDMGIHTQAIVVLTGGSERLATGIILLEQERADRMFISGVHKGVDLPGILRAAHVEVAHDLLPRIELGYRADDTEGNALETRDWVRQNHIQSLRLVTADYHIRRSLWEFQHAMPGTIIVPHPVFPEFGPSGPIRRVLLLANEYTKYAVAVLRDMVRKGGDI